MKKSAVLTYICLVLIATSGSTAHAQESLSNRTSFGLFPNTLDAALSIRERLLLPSFSSLDANYLLSGISNPAALEAVSLEREQPVMFGIYQHGPRPWSLYLSGFADSESDSTAVSGVYDEVTVNMYNESGDTVYPWVQSRTTKSFAFTESMNASGKAVYLLGMDALNIGIEAGFRYIRGDLNLSPEELTAWLERNSTIHEEHYYNTTATPPTPPPQPALDYEKVTEISDPRTRMDFSISLPLFLAAGKAAHFLRLEGRYLRKNDSFSEKTYYSEPVSVMEADFPYQDASRDVTDTRGSFAAGLQYELILPPVIHTDNANETLLSFSGTCYLNSASSYEEEAVTVTGSVDRTQPKGSRKLESGSIETTIMKDRDIANWYEAELGLSHSFYVGLSPEALFAFRPGISLSYSTVPDKDNLFSALDDGTITAKEVSETVTTTTGETPAYSRTVSTTERSDDAAGVESRLGMQFQFPTALKIHAAGWPFGFILSSRITAGGMLIYEKDLQSSERTTVVEYAEDGTELSSTETYPAAFPGEEVESVWAHTEWTFETRNALSLNFKLLDRVIMDVILNWNNLFDFDNLVVQVGVPLP